MKPRHVPLALLVAVIWGLAFVASKLALASFSPATLTALRFLIAALPAAFLPRPRIAWSTLILIALTLFAGQFWFQFSGMALGMPPGLASIVVQTQAFFTVLFAAVALHDAPTRRQLAGMAVAFAGLGLVAVTIGPTLTGAGFSLTVISPVSWGIGNVLLKRNVAESAQPDVFPLVVWLSVVPPLPFLALSLVGQGPRALAATMARASWLTWGAAIYLGVVATLVGYAIWGALLRRYPVATVTPFALLVPFVGAAASWAVFGERFEPLRLAGMACVMLGLAIVALPLDRLVAIVGRHAPDIPAGPI